MKIGFTGTQSVGKTTLVNELKKLPEFKDYNFRTERSKYLMGMGIPLNTDSTVKGQTVFLAERASELMQENIITDRTIIDVMAFTKCSNTIPCWDKHNFCRYASCMIGEYDHIFYVSPKGVKIEDNGIRETDLDYRNLIDKTILELLDKYSITINWSTIEGTMEERIALIKETLFP